MRRLIVTDHMGARIYRIGQSPQGTFRLEAEEGFETQWIETEHHRPSPLVRRGVRSYGSWEGEELERTRHCARDLAKWIRKQIRVALNGDHIKILTPVRLLGHLKEELGDALNERVVLAAGEFAKVPPGRLLEHPVLLDWLSAKEA